jgi:hypothetical protein
MISRAEPLLSVKARAESLLRCLPGDAQAGPDGGPGLASLAGPDDRGGKFGFGGA